MVATTVIATIINEIITGYKNNQKPHVRTDLSFRSADENIKPTTKNDSGSTTRNETMRHMSA